MIKNIDIEGCNMTVVVLGPADIVGDDSVKRIRQALFYLFAMYLRNDKAAEKDFYERDIINASLLLRTFGFKKDDGNVQIHAGDIIVILGPSDLMEDKNAQSVEGIKQALYRMYLSCIERCRYERNLEKDLLYAFRLLCVFEFDEDKTRDVWTI